MSPTDKSVERWSNSGKDISQSTREHFRGCGSGVGINEIRWENFIGRKSGQGTLENLTAVKVTLKQVSHNGIASECDRYSSVRTFQQSCDSFRDCRNSKDTVLNF